MEGGRQAEAWSFHKEVTFTQADVPWSSSHDSCKVGSSKATRPMYFSTKFCLSVNDEIGTVPEEDAIDDRKQRV